MRIKGQYHARVDGGASTDDNMGTSTFKWANRMIYFNVLIGEMSFQTNKFRYSNISCLTKFSVHFDMPGPQFCYPENKKSNKFYVKHYVELLSFIFLISRIKKESHLKIWYFWQSSKFSGWWIFLKKLYMCFLQNFGSNFLFSGLRVVGWQNRVL